MATVNFSVPDDVKKAFDKTFKGSNKSAIMTSLMRRAIEEEQLRARRLTLFEQLTEKRARRPTATRRQMQTARQAGRP